MSTHALNSKIQKWADGKWNTERREKESLVLYNSLKNRIKEEKIYVNRYSSVLLFRARTNTLPLNIRKRHSGEDTFCPLCREAEETFEHFLLHCPRLQEIRTRHINLQRPFIEDSEKIIVDFMSQEDDLEETKECLYKMWSKRKTIKNASN